MAKERYIKIGAYSVRYYPIDSMMWQIDNDSLTVRGFEMGVESNEPIIIVAGEDAPNLIALLDEMSFDIDVLRESNG